MYRLFAPKTIWTEPRYVHLTWSVLRQHINLLLEAPFNVWSRRVKIGRYTDDGRDNNGNVKGSCDPIATLFL